MSRERLVVIGNGMAGARLVEDVLALGGGDRFDITMFGDEPYGNYNRILLSGVLAGTHDPRDIFINPLEWYTRSQVRLHAGVRAERVVRDTRTVEGDGGVRERFDHLVFATGSMPFVPPIEGLAGPGGDWRRGVFVFRTLDDCEGMTSYARQCRTAVVIGGGLLGLEAARGLMAQGLEVHVVHLMPHLMEVQLDRRAGRMLAASLSAMGVQIHCERQTRAIVGETAIEGLEFTDGTTLACDMVVLAAGIRPNVGLAREAGLRVDRGIVVDDGLACPGAPGIYAIGECAQHRGQLYGLVAPLWDQAAVLATRLTGRDPRAAYTGSVVSTKLKVAGVDLTVMGEKEPVDEQDEVVTYAEPGRGIYKKLIVRDGRLAGAILLGDGDAAPRLMQAFDRGDTVPDNRAELLFPLAAGAEPAFSAADLPDSTQICNCNGVSKARLVAAVRDGCRTLKAVCDATRAGTGCGSCKTQVQSIFEHAAGGRIDVDPAAHYYVPGVAMTKPQLVEAIRRDGLKSVSAVFAALAGGLEDPASKAGLASLLRTIWGAEYVDERDARFINDRVHANIQKDGTFSVVPRIYGGVTSADQLRRIADVADKYQVPMVKITGGQRIDLLGLRKEQLPDVWRDLGMASGHAYSKAFRTCKTCVGTEFCRYGVGDSTGLGIKIERTFQGLEAPHKMKLATAGCPRNCSEATTKDVGAVAIEGGRWEIYVGGAAGSRVRKGDILCVVETHEQALTFMGRFMQYYREHARYLERTYAFVERVGIERLRGVLVEDEEGIASRLDAEIDRAVAEFVDPWLEATAPVHPSQFRTTVGAVIPEGSE